MRGFSIRLILPLVLFQLFSIIGFVYADCDATPDVPQETSGDCLQYDVLSINRIECCAQKYPSVDQATSRHLCERRKKMNAADAKKFQESFTSGVPKGTIQTDRVPIIFIPGVAGTRLNDESGLLTHELWPKSTKADRAKLGLLPDGKKSATGAKVSVGRILRDTLPEFIANYYGSFLESLVALGYREDIDLYTFAYDWRCSNGSQYRLLDEMINTALSRTSKSKVILTAHSMGGLIARGYVYSSSSRAAKVDTFITMGTPYWGASKVFYGIVNGYTFGNRTVNHRLMKVLLQNYPAAYQLLPQWPFITDKSSGQKLSLEDSNTIRYKWFTNVSNELLLPDKYDLTAGNERFFNPALLKEATEFYGRVGNKDKPEPLPPGVKQYAIIGHNISTLGSYELEDWTPQHEWGTFLEIKNGRKVVFRPKSTTGDGTVPLWGAETGAATATYYIPYTKIIFGIGESSEHGELPGNKTVQAIVAKILNGSPPDPNEYRKPQDWMGEYSTAKELESLTEFILHSDAHLRISHTSGRILGFNNEEKIEETLPGTFLDLDGIEYASLADMDATYKVEVTGLRDGKFTLDVDITKKGYKHRYTYPEVEVKKGTVATLILTPDQVPPAPEMTITPDGKKIAANIGPSKGPARAEQPFIDKSFYVWVRKGFGNCSGGDVASTEGNAVPAESYCNAKTVGQTAVCWDNFIKVDANGRILCTYKNVLAGNCTGGQNSGFVYECAEGHIQTDAGVGPPSRPPKPQRPPGEGTSQTAPPPVQVTPPPPPPPVETTPPPPPPAPPPQKPARVPGKWSLISMEQHGNLDRAPAREGDGDMFIEDAKMDENGGEFTVRIQMADAICAQREQESMHVKWRFNSDIRLLAPGATVPVTVEVHPVSIGTRCPFAVGFRSEFILVWGSGGHDLFPESERKNLWGIFSNAQGSPGRRFNFYQMGPEDTSAASGSTAFEITQVVPGPTDPQRGYFGFSFHTNACCGGPPPPKRGIHGFWYVYEFGGK